jgi:succinate dehydrogenase/fumarate reductase flavoprotein subunit
MQAGVDISKELLQIKPVAHYTMGGIEANMTTTDIKGLFVCGECGANGVHGANRLGGNSLLEGAVFGELAGQKALKFIESKEYLPIDYNIVVKDQRWVDHIFDQETTKNFNAMRISLGKTLFEHVGISRTQKSLQIASDYLRYLRRESSTLHTMDKSRNNNVELIAILELRNALEVSEAIVLSAMKRQESRGAHFRGDFPKPDESLKKHIILKELKPQLFKIWLEDTGLLSKLRRFLSH